MKIHRLDLRAFGPFTDLTLDLSGGSEGFHLVFGRNEAGKSSALRALRNLLYGIPANSSDDFVHPYPKLRVGAMLARRDGTQLEVLRRKGAKGTLLASDDKTPLDAGELRAFLGGCDQPQFDTMFGIDHASLIAGGHDILRGHGEVGHVLFAAGAGIADLRTIRNNLQREADDLFKPSGSKPVVNQSLAALKAARQRIREAQLPSSQWVEHNRALREARDRAATIESELQELTRQKARLERLHAALPAMGRCRQIEQRLAQLGDVPSLSTGFSEKRRDTVARGEAARTAEREAAEEVARLDGLLAGMAVPENLLGQAEAIEAVYRAMSVNRQAQSDLPGLEATRQQHEQAAAAILTELCPQWTPATPLAAAARPLKLNKRQQVDIQNLGNRKEAVEKQLALAEKNIAECTARLDEAREQLAALPPTADAAPLAEAIREVQSQGNLERQAAEAAEQLAAMERQAAIDLKRLGLWNGTLEALEAQALPSADTIDRCERDLLEAQAAVARGDEARRKNESDAADIDRRIEQLRLEGAVPSEEELAAARQRRERGWRLVLAHWQRTAIDAAELQAFLATSSPHGAEADLIAAYEAAVRKADELADRLRREANRVATRAGLTADRLALQQQQTLLIAQHDAAQQTIARLDGEWRALWEPLGIAPLPPREMRGWMQRQRALVEQACAIRERQALIARLAQRIAECRERLTRHLEAHTPKARAADMKARSASEEGVLRLNNALSSLALRASSTFSQPHESNAPSLVTLLNRCETVRQELEATAETRRQLQRDVGKLTPALAAAESAATSARAELQRWQEQWAAAIGPLGLSGSESPAVVNEVVGQIGELFARLKDADAAAQRISEIAAYTARFRTEAERLAAAAGAGPVAAEGHEAAVEDLVRRLRQATVEQKKAEVLRQQRAKQDEKRQQAHATAEQSAALLGVLCQEAGCAEPDALPAAERAAAEAAGLRAQLETCNQELIELGAGMPIETFLAEAENLEADDVPSRLERLTSDIAAKDQELRALSETIGGEKTVLAGMDTSAAAAEAAEEVEQIVSHLEPDVRQYLRLRLASALLQEGIQRYRKQNEGPVLARASALIRRLTLGSIESLQIDFDDRGEQVLAGVRPGDETVLPTAMSEGTCDQLYLALRLASLETWLARNEPLPFIVDDILVSFDNERATATLEVLAELSRQTQVIFFAHHAHLIELAEGSVPKDVLFVHRL